MPKHIQVVNNEVVQCLDYLPENATGDWRIAVEIKPNFIGGRQILGAHSFDLSKVPVEINWSVIDLTIDDRKSMLNQKLNQESYEIVHNELIKEFNGQNSNFSFVQTAITLYRIKRDEINALDTHEAIDAFIAANG